MARKRAKRMTPAAGRRRGYGKAFLAGYDVPSAITRMYGNHPRQVRATFDTGTVGTVGTVKRWFGYVKGRGTHGTPSHRAPGWVWLGERARLR